MRAVALAFVLGWAPLQCGSEPDHELRRRETPGEALYVLAQKFKKKGDDEGWRTTLEHLVERYPNSRFAVRAKQDLGGSATEASDD